jgi:hypothetical protein
MATSRSRFSDEKVDEISENSEVETDSINYNSDSDNVSSETSSQRASSLRSNKRTFLSTSSGYTSTVLQKLKGDTPMDFLNLLFDENWQ